MSWGIVERDNLSIADEKPMLVMGMPSRTMYGAFNNKFPTISNSLIVLLFIYTMKNLNKWDVIQTDEWLFVIIRKEEESYECVKISDWWFETLSSEEVLQEDVKAVMEE